MAKTRRPEPPNHSSIVSPAFFNPSVTLETSAPIYERTRSIAVKMIIRATSQNKIRLVVLAPLLQSSSSGAIRTINAPIHLNTQYRKAHSINTDATTVTRIHIQLSANLSSTKSQSINIPVSFAVSFMIVLTISKDFRLVYQ